MSKKIIECVAAGFDKSPHNGKRITSKEHLLKLFSDIYEITEQIRKEKYSDDFTEGELLVEFIKITNKQLESHGFKTENELQEQENDRQHEQLEQNGSG